MCLFVFINYSNCSAIKILEPPDNQLNIQDYNKLSTTTHTCCRHRCATIKQLANV